LKKTHWREKGSFVWPLLLAALLGARGQASAADLQPVKELTRAADLVFRGTVRQTGAANLSLVEPDAGTAIVRIDELLKASGTLDDFAGREITVFLTEPLSAGDQRVFFTIVRLLGESLGAQEVGRAAGLPADLKEQVRGAEMALRREDLEARLAAADLVVSGRVLSTRATSGEPKAGPLTEHDPQWWEAVVEVGSVHEGGGPERTVSFWYPASLDVMWARVPKPGVGQEGTWLLHRHTPEGGAPVFAVIDPRDLLSPAEAETAKGLVKP
jgi:hypothetical protein